MKFIVFLLSFVVASNSCEEKKDFSDSQEYKTIYVNSELLECQGVGLQTCMQVKDSPDDSWSLFYETIEGFTYEAGYTYTLEIKVTEVEAPLEDASSLKYALVKVIAKEKAKLNDVQNSEATLAGVNSIAYQETTRGFFERIEVSETTIRYFGKKSEIPTKTKKCTAQTWAKLKTLLNNVPITSINDLDPPSTGFQTDAARHSNLEVMVQNKKHVSSTFDSGQSPEKN